MRHIKSLILLSILAAGASAVEIGVGVDGGLQLAWFDRWVVEVPTAGLNVPVFLTDEHCVQISARYSPKGYEYDSVVNYESQWLHYLDVPVMYKYGPKFLPIRLGVVLGWDFCLLQKVNVKGFDGFEPFPGDYKEFYKTFDHGPLVGLSLKIPLKVGALTTEVLFYRGLTTVREKWWDNSSGTYLIDKKNNHAFSMLLGYEIPNLIAIGGN
jgi:hypothetical protein